MKNFTQFFIISKTALQFHLAGAYVNSKIVSFVGGYPKCGKGKKKNWALREIRSHRYSFSSKRNFAKENRLEIFREEFLKLPAVGDACK